VDYRRALPGRVNFSAVLSRNAGFLATNFNDNVVRVWALPSGELVHALDTKADPATFEQPGMAVLGGAFSDGRLFLVGGSGNKLRIWSLK
jgi:WD40 repeat protein